MMFVELFCGSMGVSKAFAERGFDCIGFDLNRPTVVPYGCQFVQMDILDLQSFHFGKGLPCVWPKPDFGWASSPCENFTVHCMKNFHPNPPYPELGIHLFNHARSLFEALQIPYVMENVACAERFVGPAVAHCGSFYLWGTAVPPLLHRGIRKGLSMARTRGADGKRVYEAPTDRMWSTKRKQIVAQIPPELAACVADYAERILEHAPRV